MHPIFDNHFGETTCIWQLASLVSYPNTVLHSSFLQKPSAPKNYCINGTSKYLYCSQIIVAASYIMSLGSWVISTPCSHSNPLTESNGSAQSVSSESSDMSQCGLFFYVKYLFLLGKNFEKSVVIGHWSSLYVCVFMCCLKGEDSWGLGKAFDTLCFVFIGQCNSTNYNPWCL